MIREIFFTDNYRILSKILKTLRQKQGISQKNLAEKLNRAQSYVSKYENNARRVDVIELVEISSVLNTDPEKIIKEVRRLWVKDDE